MSWYAAVLDLTLNTEMELHRKYAAEFGITEAELARQVRNYFFGAEAKREQRIPLQVVQD